MVVIFAVRLLMLRNDLTTFKTYWEQRAAQTVPPNATVYVALGDSAAQGIGASSPEKGYVGLIATALEAKTGGPVHVINLSVSGAKIQDVTTKQLPQLAKLNLPDNAYITMEIGANDMRGYDPVVFEKQYRELLAALPKQTVVSDIPYFGPDYHNHGGAQAKQANAVLRPILQEKGFRTAPLYETTRQRESIRNYGADLFHPSDKGYRNWFDAFWTIINN